MSHASTLLKRLESRRKSDKTHYSPLVPPERPNLTYRALKNLVEYLVYYPEEISIREAWDMRATLKAEGWLGCPLLDIEQADGSECEPKSRLYYQRAFKTPAELIGQIAGHERTPADPGFY